MFNQQPTGMGMALQAASCSAAIGLLSVMLALTLTRSDSPPSTRSEQAFETLSERVSAVTENCDLEHARIDVLNARVDLVMKAFLARTEELNVLRRRTDQLWCGIHYTADTLGKRKQLSTGRWGLKAAPAAGAWSAWPEKKRCGICDDGYECNPQPRGQ